MVRPLSRKWQVSDRVSVKIYAQITDITLANSFHKKYDMMNTIQCDLKLAISHQYQAYFKKDLCLVEAVSERERGKKRTITCTRSLCKDNAAWMLLGIWHGKSCNLVSVIWCDMMQHDLEFVRGPWYQRYFGEGSYFVKVISEKEKNRSQ